MPLSRAKDGPDDIEPQAAVDMSKIKKWHVSVVGNIGDRRLDGVQMRHSLRHAVSRKFDLSQWQDS
jgi:hypothetical protein